MSLSSLSDNDRFHNFKSDYSERTLSNALESGLITPDDANLIRGFVAERQITNSIGVKRSFKYVSMLVQVRRFIGPFTENKIPDIYLGVSKILTADSSKGRPYTSSSRADLISCIKTFYSWLIDNGYVILPEKKIRQIKRPKITISYTAQDMLTLEEITGMIDACRTSRDRAILMTLYEGGFRIGEIGEMKWEHLKIDGTGVIINTNFKTGKNRYIRLVMAREFLIKWKSDYPEEIKDEAFVFLSEKGGYLTHAAMARQIERTAKRAGITKHINPHIFRHSRITHLIQQGVNESIIKLMMWGSINSNMFANYAHLTGSDIDREIYQLYGIQPGRQTTDDKLEPKICQHCKEINSPISKHCHICGHPLDDDNIRSDQEWSDFLLENADDLIEFLNSIKAKKEKQ